MDTITAFSRGGNVGNISGSRGREPLEVPESGQFCPGYLDITLNFCRSILKSMPVTV